MRGIRLCADDYGIAPGVNAAICDLVARGRLSATSAMVVASALDADAAAMLLRAADGRAQIGLHVTMTAPFAPLSGTIGRFGTGGKFLPLGATLLAAAARGFDAGAVAREVEAQLTAFQRLFGRPPDFIDGHQHIQLFPQIRDAVLTGAARHAPAAWVRQCGRARPAGLSDPKGLLIDRLSRRFRDLAARRGITTSPAFAGTYRFDETADFAAIFPRFLDGLPDGGLIMCHPGHMDDTLRRLDSLTTLREREYAYLAGEKFPADLASADARLL